MAYLNYVAVIGNLTREPEVRYTQGGTPVCDFSIAMSRKSKTATGEERNEVCYLDITRPGKGADGLARHLGKGVQVLVTGSLKFDAWKDESGKKQSRIKVMADRVQFLNPPPRNEQQAAPEQQSDPHRIQQRTETRRESTTIFRFEKGRKSMKDDRKEKFTQGPWESMNASVYTNAKDLPADRVTGYGLNDGVYLCFG